MIKKINIKNEKINTKILIKRNYINKYIQKILNKNKNVYCIIDNKIKHIVKDFLNKKNFNCFFIKCSEEIKSIDTYNQLCENLLAKNIDRKSILISIGGGTLGDLSGFIASTLLRGIEFKLIPTTLLSQVDSSIGGKNGINTKFGKNLIGTFYHPNEVIIDSSLLSTLPLREIKSGYSEIIKHALIKDITFFNWLDLNSNKFFELNSKVLEKAINKSIMIKLWYVNKDVKENLINSNSRGMLNFGHTIGHALETYYKFGKNKLTHGEAVSIGMIVESKISNKLGYLSDTNLKIILEHFKKNKLKIYDKNINNIRIIKNLLKDKKNYQGQLNIVLLKGIGNSFFARNVNLKQIHKILKNI